MGLIKLVAGALGAASGAFNTTTSSMWVDYFESGDMSNGVIMKRGVRITGPKSQNKNNDTNIITSGSGIDVQENQCMILVENGAIVDFCAEPGRYTFDSSLAPSFMSGNNKGLAALAQSFGNQFLAGGQRTNTQRVFYINLGEIQGFKWGSGNITFDHWERDLQGNPCWHIATTLMGNGVYSIQVTDPAKFFSMIGAAKAGADGSGLVTRQDIEPQIKTEAIAAIRQAVGGLSKLKIGYTDIAGYEMQLTKDVDKLLDDDWQEARGISMFKIAIGMMDADEKSQQKILKYQEARGYADPTMLGTYIGMGQTDALNTAAGNTAGAVTGFAGYGMVGGVAGGGLNVANLMQQGAQQQQYQAAQQQVNQAPAQDTWKCSCGSVNTGKFCPNCGQPKPEAAGLKFCPECGQPFADPVNPPKFCPNCGTKIG
ncbi:MAG: SPFH domain-containing protein [Lachnospiraceae bacterium]|nr:SPFH domain-containing protein [Lachnospiraceae bacterium]MBR7015180.1 SPFH domain-containing protein [Lachnospiraceae bacterium]